MTIKELVEGALRLFGFFAVGLVIGILVIAVIVIPTRSQHDTGLDAKTVMKSLLKDVSNRGYGLARYENVVFDNVPIYKTEIVAGMSVTAPSLDCSSDAFCNQGNPIKVENDRILVNKKTTGTVVVCTGDGSNYWIIVGERGKTGLENAVILAEDSSHCNLDVS